MSSMTYHIFGFFLSNFFMLFWFSRFPSLYIKYVCVKHQVNWLIHSNDWLVELLLGELLLVDLLFSRNTKNFDVYDKFEILGTVIFILSTDIFVINHFDISTTLLNFYYYYIFSGSFSLLYLDIGLKNK